MKTFHGIAELEAAAGTDLGASDWLLVDQQRIDLFAEATGDHQWIHVDPERAKDGPFGATIAHGFLTLSLMPVLQHGLYDVQDVRMAVNYGLNKVRFITPVVVGSRVRAACRITAADAMPGAVQITFETTIEIDGVEKPAAVIESIARFFA